jgi:hypothetical protein
VPTVNDSEMLWHNDGHHISLRLNKSDVEITEIFCPAGDGGQCRHARVGCVVDYFINRFGLDCNVGVCSMQENIQICWSLVGDTFDIDSAQLWFVPLDDEVFQAWLSTKY